ncbi:MAG: acyloxyacyl hydrolase [Chitinispirillales bacterium]|jgi:hypothetical protein|nr:acyloxyacyl hydrolase [Chitinispirillales bacterium]
MSKKVQMLLYLLFILQTHAEIPNPAFGGNNDQISVRFSQSIRDAGKLEDLFIFELCYSQPNKFFRLPGRQNMEFITQRGNGELSKYNQDIIFGLSQDLISPAIWRMYAGINLGIYIKSQVTDRIDSKFTFGERIFLGVRILNEFRLELSVRHFSNGSLTHKNSGQNFAGLNTSFNF